MRLMFGFVAGRMWMTRQLLGNLSTLKRFMLFPVDRFVLPYVLFQHFKFNDNYYSINII